MTPIIMMRGESRTSLTLVHYGAIRGAYGWESLYLLNAVGNSSATKAAAAMLRGQHDCSFGMGSTTVTRNSDFKWKTLMCGLGLDTHQLLAWCLDPCFMPKYTADHLWAMLNSDKFTTPLLQAWKDYVVDACQGFVKSLGGGSAYCTLKQDNLDEIVTRGIQVGRIRIE